MLEKIVELGKELSLIGKKDIPKEFFDLRKLLLQPIRYNTKNNNNPITIVDEIKSDLKGGGSCNRLGIYAFE